MTVQVCLCYFFVHAVFFVIFPESEQHFQMMLQRFGPQIKIASGKQLVCSSFAVSNYHLLSLGWGVWRHTLIQKYILLHTGKKL